MSDRVVSRCVPPEEREAELRGRVFVLYRGAGANKVIENTDISSWLFTDDTVNTISCKSGICSGYDSVYLKHSVYLDV